MKPLACAPKFNQHVSVISWPDSHWYVTSYTSVPYWLPQRTGGETLGPRQSSSYPLSARPRDRQGGEWLAARLGPTVLQETHCIHNLSCCHWKHLGGNFNCLWVMLDEYSLFCSCIDCTHSVCIPVVSHQLTTTVLSSHMTVNQLDFQVQSHDSTISKVLQMFCSNGKCHLLKHDI